MSFRATEHDTEPEPTTSGVRVRPVYLMQDATSGVWGFTADRREAEAYFTRDAASAVLGIDSAATAHETGLRVVSMTTRVLAYTPS